MSGRTSACTGAIPANEGTGRRTMTRVSRSDELEVLPTVERVLRFEDLPVGETGSRRAVVRWSDGTDGEALRWYEDPVLVSEGDLIGKTQAELRSLHFRRDRDWLES